MLRASTVVIVLPTDSLVTGLLVVVFKHTECLENSTYYGENFSGILSLSAR
jgi:hypothetical protein